MASASIYVPSAGSVDQSIQRSQTARQIFLGGLAVVTFLPPVVFNLGLDTTLLRGGISTVAIVSIIAATNVGHVLSTALFYVDQELSDLIRENPRRFFSLPALMIVGCFVIFSASAAAWMLLVSVYNVWQIHHYQRQNYGIVAFAAQGAGVQKLPPQVKWMFDLAVAGGACNLVASLWFKAASPAVTVVHGLSGVLFLAAFVMLIKLVLEHAQLRSNPYVLLFMTAGWAFFLPTFVHPTALLSLWATGVAHGAQYLVFMAVITGNRKRGVVGLALLALIMVPAFFLFLSLGSKLLMAIYTGVVMGHFVIDAKVWRLREMPQHQIVGRRFSFLFPPARPV